MTAGRALTAIAISLAFSNSVRAETSDAECNEFSAFVRYMPYQLKSVVIHGKDRDLLDFTDQDWDYVTSALNDCKSRIRGVARDPTKFVKQYRRYFDIENADRRARQDEYDLNLARRELDNYNRKIFTEAEIGHIREIGAKYRTLKNYAELTINRNEEKIARNAAQEDQNKKAEAAAQKEKEEQTAFVASLPPSCTQLVRMKGNPADADKAAKANMLAQAGETEQACTLISEIDSSMEQMRISIVQCYNDISGRQDQRSQNVASAALYQAGQVHQGQLQFRQAEKQLGCK